ncbi:MAG: hypothetical protein ACE5KM_01070 [Planctomycetaceae bacterium]
MIFLFPLVLSFAALAFFIVSGDFGLRQQLIAAVLVVGAAAMQFVPPLRERIHFIVPLLLQIGVCLWYLIDRQVNG